MRESPPPLPIAENKKIKNIPFSVRKTQSSTENHADPIDDEYAEGRDACGHFLPNFGRRFARYVPLGTQWKSTSGNWVNYLPHPSDAHTYSTCQKINLFSFFLLITLFIHCIRQQRSDPSHRWIFHHAGGRAYFIRALGQLYVYCNERSWRRTVHGASDSECATEMDSPAKRFERSSGRRYFTALSSGWLSDAGRHMA